MTVNRDVIAEEQSADPNPSRQAEERLKTPFSTMLSVGADRVTSSSGPVVDRHVRPWEIADSERVVNVLNTCRNGPSHHNIIEGTMTQISDGESNACAITHA